MGMLLGTRKALLQLGGAGSGTAAPLVDTAAYDFARQEEYAEASGTSVALTLRQTPVDGNLLVCRFGAKRPVLNLIGPGAGWTAAWSKQASTTVSGGLWYKIAASDSATVTCTQDAAAASMSMMVTEYPGPWDASPLDKTASANAANVTSLSTGTTAATAQANELVCAMLYTHNNQPLRLVGWTNSFDGVLSPNLGGPRLHAADRLLAATGTVETTPSWETSFGAVVGIATFKLATTPTRPAMPVRRLASGTFSAAEVSSTTKVTRAFAPTVGRLVLCLLGQSYDPGMDDTTTLGTSHGGSMVWTKAAEFHIGVGNAARHVHLFRAMSATDPGSDTVTITYPVSAVSTWYSFFEVGGVDTTGSNGSGAIAQYATGQNDPGTSQFVDIIQAVAPAASSMMVGVALHGDSDRHLHEAGYHIIQEGTCGSDKTQEVSAFWYPAGDQTARVSWTTPIHCIAIAAEIKRAA